MKSLIAFTIGPVQTYISESKKMIDLQNSSEIITSIVRSIIEYIKKNNGEIIFPHYESINSNNITNYIIADIENGELLDIDKELERIYNNFTKSFFLKCNIDGNKSIVDKIKDPFRCTWSIVDINNNYEESYEKIVGIISSLKSTYIFQQKVGRTQKCTICSKRDGVERLYKAREEIR